MVTARLTDLAENGWRLELDGQEIPMGTPPETERRSDSDRRLLAIRVAEWSLLDRGWKPAGGWTWDAGVATVGLVEADPLPEPAPTSVQRAAIVAGPTWTGTHEEAAAMVAAEWREEFRQRYGDLLDRLPRFGMREVRRTPAHVTFALSAATGGQWLGGAGQLTLATAEYDALRVILGPFLVDRPDPH